MMMMNQHQSLLRGLRGTSTAHATAPHRPSLRKHMRARAAAPAEGAAAGGAVAAAAAAPSTTAAPSGLQYLSDEAKQRASAATCVGVCFRVWRGDF
jgi:hypothetical protein